MFSDHNEARTSIRWVDCLKINRLQMFCDGTSQIEATASNPIIPVDIFAHSPIFIISLFMRICCLIIFVF